MKKEHSKLVGIQKIFPFTILMVLICLCMYIWHIREEYTSDVRDVYVINNSINELEWTFIESLITENYFAAGIQAKHTALNIMDELKLEYPDMNLMQKELENKNEFNTPDFIKVMKRNIDGKYFHGIENDDNDMFVCDSSGVLVDISFSTAPKKYPNNWENIHSRSVNPVLSKKAVEMIFNKSKNFIWWAYKPQETEVTYDIYSIQEPSLDELHKIFISKGIEGFKYIEFLSPAYITEDGDIFGIDDINEYGLKTANNKIVVVQSFNMYQQLIANHPNEIKSFEIFREKMVTERKMSLVESVFGIALVIVLVIILIYFMMIFVNIVFKEHDEEEKIKE